MTITREQVADLREGDIVEYHRHDWPEGTVIRGPLKRHALFLWIGLADYPIRFHDGDVSGYALDKGTTLTVISRVPRLYVNHDRTQPVVGDVVRDADDVHDTRTWVHGPGPGDHNARFGWQHLQRTGSYYPRAGLPARLRLLVDGEVGNVVPS